MSIFQRMGVLAVVLLCLISYGCSQSAKRPNILLIFTDDQGYNDVG